MQTLKGKVRARLSPLVLDALEMITRKYPEGRSSPPFEAVGELSRLFTKDRSSLPRQYLGDPGYTAAYLSYFLPVNLCKIQVLLDELSPDSIFEGRSDRIAVLDLGCGPGTGALAVLDWLHLRKPDHVSTLSVVAADASREALEQAEALWGAYCRGGGIIGAKLQAWEGNLERLEKGQLGDRIRQGGPYDLIILANCLNEIFAGSADATTARAQLLSDLLPLLAPHGTMMIVEPALRETSRQLHQVRDRLLQEKRCTVYSPCLHEKNCPALANPDDWCHEERAWEPPAMIRKIDQEVGFIKDALKFSYLLLRTDGKTIVERRPDLYRVVSELRELKGEKRAWLCNELGRQEVGRQDRLASAQNESLDQWHRGAIVQIERIVRKKHDGKPSALGRIGRDASVQIIRSV